MLLNLKLICCICMADPESDGCHRFDFQTLFRKRAYTPPLTWEGTKTRHKIVAEIKPSDATAIDFEMDCHNSRTWHKKMKEQK